MKSRYQSVEFFKYVIFLLIPVVFIIFGGCRSTAYLQSLVDPDLIPPKDNLCVVSPPDSASFEEKIFIKNFKNTMVDNGFLFATNCESANYIIVLTLDKESIPYSYLQPILSSSSLSGRLGKDKVNLRSFNIDYAPMQDIEFRKNILVAMYYVDKPNDLLSQVWEIHLSTKADVFNDLFEDLPKAILKYYCIGGTSKYPLNFLYN